VSDRLRQAAWAAWAVVRAWEREFGTTEDAVAFERSIDALRAALAEGDGDDPYPHWYWCACCKGDNRKRVRFDGPGKPSLVITVDGPRPPGEHEFTDEAEIKRAGWYVRTDAEGNRQEAPAK
jgi:hypothetical protein